LANSFAGRRIAVPLMLLIRLRGARTHNLRAIELELAPGSSSP
jgi:hypothetical protein